MIERYLTLLRTDDAQAEEPAATRQRLQAHFARGATRRMTQLGMMVGAVLQELQPQERDTVLYASIYAETRALESYLESFPGASPTLFQTSIHPSGVQQGLIGRQQPIRTLLPMTGGAHLVAQLLTAALLDPGPRVIICGGEERGSWLLEKGAASPRSFAFAAVLERQSAAPVARITYQPAAHGATPLPFPDFFDALHHRRSINVASPHGGRCDWNWL